MRSKCCGVSSAQCTDCPNVYEQSTTPIRFVEGVSRDPRDIELDQLRTTIAVSRKEVEGLRVDALRYRWLRLYRNLDAGKYPSTPWVMRLEMRGTPTSMVISDSVLDAAIDAAIGGGDATKPRRIEPYTPAWERLANALAREYVRLYPCAQCGGPVNDGYICQRCGSTNPREVSNEAR